MLVPQSHPCPECGHPRAEHQMPKAGFAEVCHCGCTATWEGWAQLPKRPSANIMPLVVAHEEDEPPWLATYEGFELRDGEAEWLTEIEQLTRALWKRNVPKAKPVTGDLGRDNAEAERCFNTTRRIRELWARFAN